MSVETPEPSCPEHDTTGLHRPPLGCPVPELPLLDHLPIPELIEAVLAHQRQCWEQGNRVPVDRYLDGYPALRADPDAAADVIYQEYVLRTRDEDPTLFAEYVRRFPQCAE